MMMNMNDRNMDEEDSFENPYARRRFIRMVFFLLTIQLLFTSAIVAIFVFNEDVQEYIYHNMLPFYICVGLLIPLSLAVSCIQALRRKVPLNYIVLIVFTVLKSICLGYITSLAEPMKVLIALGITAGMVAVLCIFAMQTRLDFTVCNAAIIIVSVLLLVLGLVAIFVRNRIFFIALSCLGVLAASLYLVYDIQLMMGGKRYTMHVDEYTFGALNLYFDIILMFTQILNLLEASD